MSPNADLPSLLERLGPTPTDAELGSIAAAFLVWPATFALDAEGTIIRRSSGGHDWVVVMAEPAGRPGAELIATVRTMTPSPGGILIRHGDQEAFVPSRCFPAPPLGKAPAGWFQDLRNRYEDLLAQYGTIAVVVYFTIFVGSIAAFYIALELGFDIGGDIGEVGKVGAAWAATKVLQPLRILATLALTPIVAAVKQRFWPAAPPSAT